MMVSYKFWPVGQGLFSSGEIYLRNGSKFRWVYDCGTSSAPEYVKDSIDKLHNAWGGGKPKIDLLVISHFDADHISGLVLLLSKFSIGTLLLPYMPLWQRLLVAFANGVEPEQRAMRFFVDPVQFVVDASGDRTIDQIVFVSAGGEGPPVSDVGEQNQNPDGPTLVGQYRSEDQLEEEQRSLRGEATSSGNPRYPAVKYLAEKSSLVVGGVWEFVPYNDASIKIKAGASGISVFQKKVAKCRKQLLAVPNKNTLKELKGLYDERFGCSGLAKNLISLFVYAGPLRHLDNGEYRFNRMIFWSPGKEDRRDRMRNSTRSSVLYTGDGYLNSQKRFDALKNYLKPERIAQISCLQVMHHGAEDNWFQGLARKLSPDISVFSSNPDHKGLNHPHGCVVRDFLMFTPLQVDKNHGLEIHVHLFP
jgi:Metallo-beta-lactamase superfamily